MKKEKNKKENRNKKKRKKDWRYKYSFMGFWVIWADNVTAISLQGFKK